jgi:hypothetical protein
MLVGIRRDTLERRCTVSEPTTDVSGHDDEIPDLPNPETGIGIGAGQSSNFEPEEDDPTDDQVSNS